MKILCAGGGGFIGSHLVDRFVAQGHEVVAVDIKPLSKWAKINPDAKNIPMDLSNFANCLIATKDCDEVYMLAADMGGMGYIENNKLACMLTVIPSTNMLRAASKNKVGRYFYSSSACVYAADAQNRTDVTALVESDAYPAMPEDGYGWEKLFTERMCRHFTEDEGLVTRVARFHNVYGPYTHYEGGREKAPAAITRKVIEAKLTGDYHINIWGDGLQTRSFMEVADCVEGIDRIMHSEIYYPINLGSSELVSINQLVDIAEEIAGVELERTYDLSAPQGVRGRNSDNTLIKQELNWEPSTSLHSGMERLYAWVYGCMTS